MKTRQPMRAGVSRLSHSALAFLVLSSASSIAVAQNPADSTPVHELTLVEHPDIRNGKIALVEGNTDAEGVRMLVSKLSILQPVGVALVSDDPNDDIKLQLWKYAEDAVQREGSTRGTGYVSFPLRTEDDLQIKVVSPGGSKHYRLAVWVGNEIDPPMAPAFVSQAGVGDSGGGGGGFPRVLMYVLTAGIVAIAVLLGVLVLRRKSS